VPDDAFDSDPAPLPISAGGGADDAALGLLSLVTLNGVFGGNAVGSDGCPLKLRTVSFGVK
jgi:hypothetical protein